MPDGAFIEEFCAPDAVSPAQFYEMWSGTGDRSAEFKLAVAVLEQALEDLAKHRHATSNNLRRLHRQAETWFRSNDREWPYSFVNVCEMLDVPSDRLRILALATRAAPVAVPVYAVPPSPPTEREVSRGGRRVGSRHLDAA